MFVFCWQGTYQWDPELEDSVYYQFCKTVQRRLPQIVYDAMKRAPRHRQSFIPEAQMAALQEKMNSEGFKKKSETQRSNRRQFSEGGQLVPTHHGGSCSAIARAKKMVIYFFS